MSETPPNPDTPVLVGVAAVQQHCEEPGSGLEAVDLMEQALRGAADDAGSAGLLDRLGWLGVPDGNWRYTDPAGLLASRVGADPHTVLGEVGILQQELFDRACAAVKSGAGGVAAVVGGEAKYRERAAEVAGLVAAEVDQGGATPAETLVAADLGLSDLEMERMLWNAVSLFAMIDNARRAAAGLTLDQHRDQLADIWEHLAAIAVDNSDAWDRSAPSAEAIRDPGPDNRMLSFPYTKLMSSQWNVDQAGALLFCSVGTAEEMGVPRDRWVYPWASAVSNHVVPLEARADPGSSPGAEIAAAAVLEAAGVGIDDIAHIDLYSCFPAAVQTYRDALGVRPDRELSITGGMTFAGGPLNNYVVQALVTLVRRLRDDPAALGLSSSVSGFLVKQGFSIWSTTPPLNEHTVVDVSEPVADVDRPARVDPRVTGEARVITYTVEHAGGMPTRLVAVCETPDGTRTLGETSDLGAMSDAMVSEWIGRTVTLDDSRIVR